MPDRDRFTSRDVALILRAFKAAGVPIARVEIHRDGVTVIPGEQISEREHADEQESVAATLEKFRAAISPRKARRNARGA